MTRTDRNIAIVAGLGIVASTLLWLVVPAGPARQAVSFLLAWIWPAVTWSLWWPGVPSERLVIGAGTALMLNAVLALLVAYLPGVTPDWAILICVLLTSIAPLILLITARPAAPTDQNGDKRVLILLLGLMFVALMLRLPGMGYKEFQGDEGVAMVRAAAILGGDEAQLFVHQKGPMEILLPLTGWGLAGSTNDYWARLPFTWAGVLAVLAVYWLGRKWFGAGAGLLAGLLFAVGGFGIAFSRIVQYQSLVILWGTLSLLMATRYRASGGRPDLVMSLSFLAAGLLAHYDAILVAPAVAWLIVAGLRAQPNRRMAPLLAALLAGGLILALFYIPFVLNPTFAGTFNYLLRERVGLGGSGSPMAGGLGDAWRMMTFYNSTWYILGLGLAMVLGLVVLARKRMDFAAVLYFAVPAIFYLLVVGDPRTHVYTLFPGAAVLAGVGAISAWRILQDRMPRPVPQLAAALAILWLAVVVVYPWLLFVDTSLERQRTWDVNRPWPALYPVTWDEPPVYGLFGFPHQAGWRAAGSLRSVISLPYGSNEEPEITGWYMAQAPRTTCENAGTFMLVSNAQDEVPYDAQWLDQELSQFGQVTVNGQQAMQLYTRDDGQPLVRLAAENHDVWLTPAEAAPLEYVMQVRNAVKLGEQIELLGYDLDASNAIPGGQMLLTLYWQASEPIERNYQVFVHLYDGQMWAQDDGAPNCDFQPTTGWEPGQIIADPHIINFPEDMPLGPMPVLVGMYDLITIDRLTVDGNPDNVIPLTEIMVEAK